MSTADPGIEMIGSVNGDGETILSNSPHPGGLHCAFCDGHVQFLSEAIDFKDLRALVTIDGNEGLKNVDGIQTPKNK